ncbi:MAG: tetratricopeptide repeat protein [Aureispira sp.]
MTEQALLQAADSEIEAFLTQLPHNEVNNYRCALALLWQIHPDPSIKEPAQELLEKHSTAEELQELTNALCIFDSIISYLPWAGDYRALQQQNYTTFEQNKAPYEALLMTSPVLVEQYLDLGRRLYKLFDLLSEAKACFESVLAYIPQQAEALYALGRLVEQEGNYEEAIAYYKRCIAQDGQHVYAHLQLGILQVEQEGNYEEAIKYYQVVLDIEPFMAEIHVRMAEAHRALGDLSRAKQFIDIALDINPYQEEALNLLGWIQWREEEDIDAALATFEKGVDHPIHGDSSLLLASLGQLQEEQLGDKDKAKLYYEKSLVADLQQQAVFQQLMNLLEEHYQDYGAMAQYYERYLKQPQQNPTIHTAYAAFSLKYLEDVFTAKEQLEKALALEADYLPAVALSLQIKEQEGGPIEEDIDASAVSEEEDDDDDFSGGGAAGDN